MASIRGASVALAFGGWGGFRFNRLGFQTYRIVVGYAALWIGLVDLDLVVTRALSDAPNAHVEKGSE